MTTSFEGKFKEDRRKIEIHAENNKNSRNQLKWMLKWRSESHLVVSDSLRPHGLYRDGILQARILKCVAFSFSRGSSQPKDRTQVSHTAGRFFTSWATREVQKNKSWGKCFKIASKVLSFLTFNLNCMMLQGSNWGSSFSYPLIFTNLFNHQYAEVLP